MNEVKVRHPMTWPGAIARIRGVLGLAAANAVERTDNRVWQWSDPEGETEPNLSQAVALDAAFVRATGEDPPILTVYRRRLADVVARSPHVADVPSNRLLAVMSEVGELSTDLTQALHDGRLTPNEARKVQKDIADAIEKLTKMSRDVDALASGNVSERGRE